MQSWVFSHAFAASIASVSVFSVNGMVSTEFAGCRNEPVNTTSLPNSAYGLLWDRVAVSFLGRETHLGLQKKVSLDPCTANVFLF